MIKLAPRSRGFTFIEILLVLALLGIVLSIVIASFSKLNQSQVLEKSMDLVVSVIDEARSMTLSSVDGSQYGVHFDSAEIVLFKGSSYSPSDSDNVVTSLDERVGIRDVTLVGGGTNIIFNRLTGTTDESGTLELFLHSSTTVEKLIRVTATGVVGVN